MHENAPDLAGELTAWPGVATPCNLQSSRPPWLNSLVPGTLAVDLPMLLASVFNNCAEAHRMCAQWACDAARGKRRANPLALERLQAETLREHLRRMALDWPERLTRGRDESRTRLRAMQCLREAPVLPGRPLDEWIKGAHALLPWIEHGWLGMSAESWLSYWRRAPGEWLGLWCEASDSWLAMLMRQSREAAQVQVLSAPLLRVHASDGELYRFAKALQSGETCSRAPRWRGMSAETGSWTRLAEGAPSTLDTPWLKWGSRMAEVAQLAIRRGSSPYLRAGQITLEKSHGLAWVEMSRGLLMHRVELDGECVSRCDVVAPTEWNFHPEGAVARTLESLGDAPDARVIALMTAYDPCVKFRIERREEMPEVMHA